jgi:membrane-bound lytic murein transglycosylase A
MRTRLGLMAMAVAGLLAGCETAPPPTVAPPPAPPVAGEPHHLTLRMVAFSDLPGWTNDHWSQALPALLKSCTRILQMPPDLAVGQNGIGGTARDWLGPCGALKKVGAGDDQGARRALEGWFTPYAMTDNGRPDGLFTGYYEAEVNGSRTRHGTDQVPLYGRPRELVTVDLARLRPDLAKDMGNVQLSGRVAEGRLDPYPPRSEIETKGLGDNAAPLFWLDDPVSSHILHIQGSGLVHLDDGSVQRIAVAATNGQRFIGLGHILAEHGKVEAGSTMPQIRDWLHAHPDQAKTLMAENPRYIFYRPVVGEGPIGAEGVALTPARSLAVDPHFVPLGAPIWIAATAPSGTPLARLMVAQDTGAAIKGPVRGDIFWGSGEPAFQDAGSMKSTGQAWILLPRERSPSLARLP